MANFVSPSGYVELDNDCQYSIDVKSTRSREEVNPKEDLAFYFNTYIVPKYGLENINVSNVASYMKELDMNWSRLTPDLKDKSMSILVDGILAKQGDDSFKIALLEKLNTVSSPAVAGPTNAGNSKSTFGNVQNNKSEIFRYLLAMIFGALVLLFVQYLTKNKYT